MKKISKAVVISTLLASFASLSTEITLTSQDNFNLKADYFKGQEKGTRAVLMLHQCNFNRSMYDNMGEQLAKKGIHALSLDFRGYGESINEEYNDKEIQALPQQERREKWRAMAVHWPSDVKIAYDYLKGKLSKGGTIGVIGASCGGHQAITLAENEAVTAIGFFSSAQWDENIARYKTSLATKPTLIIAAEEDDKTFTSAQALFVAAQHPQSKMISFKGKDHGYPLFELDKNLNETMVDWFANQLAK